MRQSAARAALLTKKKFKAAEQTAEISKRGIAVGENKSTEVSDAKIAELRDEIAGLDAAVNSAKDYRISLEAIVKQIQGAELDLQKQIVALETEQTRLRENLGKYSSSAGEWVNRGPVLDALYTGNIKLDQIWLPDMKINYNFSSVARYDRCIVCHRAIDKTAPGTATEAAYPAIPRLERERTVQLTTPAEQPKTVADSSPADALAKIYGITLAPRGQVEASAVTVQVVEPTSLGALAGLQMGDILQEANGGPITTQDDAYHYLLDLADWGKPISLRIRRGLGSTFHFASAIRFVCRQHEPAQKGRRGLHDLPRRAGECDRLQVGIAYAERSAARSRLVAEVRLVRQSSLDFPDDAGAVHREQLLKVSPRGRRARTERKIPRTARTETGERL